MLALAMIEVELNQSSSCPLSSTISRQPSQSATSTKPIQSILSPPRQCSARSRRRISGSSTKKLTSASESRPIGTLMKKIQCQEMLSVIAPPIVGPSAGATITVTP
jgi:hypothetical protein